MFRFGCAEENVDFFRTYYGPTLRAFESLDPPRREALRNDLLVLARRYDRNGGTGPIAITADYGTEVEVNEGVSNGDQAILQPPVNLTDGEKVHITREPPDAPP